MSKVLKHSNFDEYKVYYQQEQERKSIKVFATDKRSAESQAKIKMGNSIKIQSVVRQ
jgi:hypothetical protein